MEQENNIKIFLADDHPLIRTGLKHSLDQKDGFVLVGEASDGYSAVERIGELSPDIALIDMDMPGLSGVAVIRVLRKNMPNLKLLILSTFNEENFVREAMGAGADGYLLKNVPLDELENIIRCFCADKECFSPYLVNLGMKERLDDNKREQKHYGLTAREIEVLKYISLGTPNKEISTELFISLETVKSHVKNIYKKLGVRNRVEAVRLASDKKLLE
ncbi:response regulator transcription factor [Desulfogranum marinum]|uniref:response regulator transcription factor n=1 Tax=Desulfogranum marinum TaxID=453220 RepID=UPI0029C82BC9|nr:response regulator transcription factor [Desulfogranum marinum]